MNRTGLTLTLSIVFWGALLLSCSNAELYLAEGQTSRAWESSFSIFNGSIAQSFTNSNFTHIYGVLIYIFGFDSYGPGVLTVSIHENLPATSDNELVSVDVVDLQPSGFYIATFPEPYFGLSTSDHQYFIVISSSNLDYGFVFYDPTYLRGTLWMNPSARLLPNFLMNSEQQT